ncbi:MAG: hypothetical protein DKINENOH_04312 [bacterium]|nr:hypothetical protein [bacterium]
MLDLIVWFWLALLNVPARQDVSPEKVAALPRLTRAEIMATAERLAQHTWVCRAANRVAPCVTAVPYESDWQPNQTVTGIAYDWGGMDDPETFDRKLQEGKAAGSHSRHGITACTAGIDCSGYVSYCWGQPTRHDYSTRNIREIAGRAKYNWFTDMKPGDALNKPGDHIVLFAGYHADGRPIVYEANGGAGRVIRKVRTWASLQNYHPLQYRMVVEE